MGEKRSERRRNRPYRAAVATLFAVLVAWIGISVVGSVAFSLWGYGGPKLEKIKRLPYAVGGDNRATLRRCEKRFRWLYDELRGAMLDVAPEDLGTRGERKWRHWVGHLRDRLHQERARCHLEGDPPDPGDSALAEMADLAEAIEDLANHYAAKRKRLISDFREDLVAIEGLFGRVDARITGNRR